MILGAVTYNVLKDWDLETIIQKLEEIGGFKAVELRTSHEHGVEPSMDAAAREKVKNRFEKSRIRLLSYGTTCEFQSPDVVERERQIEIAKLFINLAHDTGAWGVKVRPNGVPQEVSLEKTVAHISEALRTLGDYAQGKGVEIWMEVHGKTTQQPDVSAAIMKATKHDYVGLCWNSNPTDLVNGSVKPNFDLLRPWIKNVHINELANEFYPYRELFALLKKSGYERYTLCEAQESKEPERFLRWYKALWTELARPAC